MPRYHNECPYVVRKSYGDESQDYCETTGRICLLEEGLECETWNEVQREWEQEAVAVRSK